jgi:hypothetical protein
VWNGFECANCSIGLYSDPSQRNCLKCQRGKFSFLQRNEKCDECAKGFYNENEGLSNCSACPTLATTTSVGSQGVNSCFCSGGYFGKAFVGEACTLCALTEGVSCDVNSSYPSTVSGLFKSPQNPNIIFECVPKEACLSSNNSIPFTECSQGYTGPICGSCIARLYFKSGANCVECPSTALKVAVLLAFIGIVIFILRRVLKFKSFSDITSIKILLFWIQIIALFPSLSTDWAVHLRIFFAIISFVNLDIDLFFPGKYESAFISTILNFSRMCF